MGTWKKQKASVKAKGYQAFVAINKYLSTIPNIKVYAFKKYT